MAKSWPYDLHNPTIRYRRVSSEIRLFFLPPPSPTDQPYHAKASPPSNLVPGRGPGRPVFETWPYAPIFLKPWATKTIASTDCPLRAADQTPALFLDC